jgi:hypothetical protein
VDLVAPRADVESDTARSLPRPQQFLLEDINVHDGAVGHQHIDFVYYGAADTRAVEPQGEDEQPADDWRWFTPEGLAANADAFADDIVEVGRDAIATVGSR